MKNLICGIKQSGLSAWVRKPQHFLHALIVCAVILFIGCDQSEIDGAQKLGVKIEIEATSESSISFKISSSNATEVRYLVAKASEGMCDAEQILTDGRPSKVNEEYIAKVNNLDRNTPYLIAVAAKNNHGVEVAYDIVTTSSKRYDEVTLDFYLVRRLLNDSYSETEFALLFTDVDPEYELTLVFNAEPNEMLPEGNYSTDGGFNATIDAKRSFLSYTNGDEPIYFDRIDAKVQIPHRDIRDKYLITADMYAGDTLYTVVIYDYVGNMPIYDTSNMVFGYPVINEKNNGKCATIIFNTEDEKATLVLEAYLYNPNRMYLMPGEYKISSGESEFVAGDIDAQNSWFIANGYYGELVSGVVNISIDDDYNYNFVVDVEDELGRIVKFEYSGFLPEMYFVRQFTLDSATISEVESGRYRMEFGGSHNLSFEVCAESLTEGSYPIVEASEAQSQYIDKATFSFSSPLGDIAIKRGEMRILQIEEDFVEFSFELHSQDYCIWKGKYHGVIQVGKAGDTTEVSYTEYSLSGTSCEWNFTKEDSEIIVVNSREELEKYIVCDGECTAPSVDFEKHSLVIAHGGCTNGIHQIGVSKFVKFADEKYGLYIDIVMGWTDAPELWTYAIITDKLSGQNSVELFVDIESQL